MSLASPRLHSRRYPRDFTFYLAGTMSSIGAGLVIPDLWQQEAVRALQQGKDVVVQAPTA